MRPFQIMGMRGGGGAPPFVWPTIADDNITAADEGTSTAPWTLTGAGSATLTLSGSKLTLGTGNAKSAARSLACPTTNDYIFYAHVEPGYGSGQYSALIFRVGATAKLEINFGYDYVGSSAVAGTISTWNYSNSTADRIATGLNYSTGVDIAMHVDRNRSAISFYILDADGKWDFRGSYAFFSDMASIDTLVASLGGSSASTSLTWDWLMYCRPNIVAIGDSICAGHNFFDPNPTVYAGEDNGSSTWMKHSLIYRSLRNHLIVNKGIGSQTSTATAARMAEATAHSPRLVFLHASSNDEAATGPTISQATRTTNIQNSINSITGAGAAAILLNASYGTSAGSDNTPTPDLRDYMKLWWDTSRPSLTGLAGSIDIMQPLLLSGFLDPAKAADGIHPNATGYQAVGEYIAAF